jgi:hypothetical protein
MWDMGVDGGHGIWSNDVGYHSTDTMMSHIDVGYLVTLWPGALEWMEDFDKFHAVIDECPSFASDLSRSLSLVLDEFYKNIRSCGVSAMTGEGMEARVYTRPLLRST